MSNSEPYTSAVSEEKQKSGSSGKFRILIFAVLIVSAGVAGVVWRTQAMALERANTALELQGFALLIGQATIEAEYDNPEAARAVASRAFDGIVAYGILHGDLPANFARVLESRDGVITGLAQVHREARDTLAALYFALQLPPDTPRTSADIIAGIEAGRGMARPHRIEASATPDSATDTVITQPGVRADTTGLPSGSR